MPRRDALALLVALRARAHGELAARLQAVVLVLLLAELHAAGVRQERRRPWLRASAGHAPARRGRRPARGSQSGRRPRG